MAYPQAPIKMDMYMELLDGILLKEGDQKDHVLKLLANLYGQTSWASLERLSRQQTP